MAFVSAFVSAFVPIPRGPFVGAPLGPLNARLFMQKVKCNYICTSVRALVFLHACISLVYYADTSGLLYAVCMWLSASSYVHLAALGYADQPLSRGSVICGLVFIWAWVCMRECKSS